MPTVTKKAKDPLPGDHVSIYGTPHVVNKVLPSRKKTVLIHTEDSHIFRADEEQSFPVTEQTP